jgi:phage/plasmid primase-like uncharacterized protein
MICHQNKISHMIDGLRKQGRYLIGPCPFCGGHDRFNIVQKRSGLELWHCRGCGNGKYQDVIDFVKQRDNLTFAEAIERLGEAQPVTAVTPVLPTRRQTTPGPAWAAAGAGRFAAHPRRYELWQAYKPLSEDTINRANLGVGVLPASRCNHERLIVPIYNDGELVCLRGRAINCDCGKWLASGGFSLDSLPLYNVDALPTGGVLWIVENPVDALMIGEATDYTGAATLAVSYWRDHWLEAIQAKRPSLVVVAYDNDLPGNGGAWRRQEMMAVWKRQRPGQQPPKAWGVKLVNRLLKAGLPVELYDWQDNAVKTDIGSLLTSIPV